MDDLLVTLSQQQIEECQSRITVNTAGLMEPDQVSMLMEQEIN